MDDEQIKKISEDVKNCGVTSLNNFFETKHLELANNVISPILRKVDFNEKEKRIYFPVFLRQILVKLLKLDLEKIKKSFLLKKIAEELNFKKIAETIFKQEAQLHMLDTYLSEKSNEFIIPWHNDIGYKNISNREAYEKEAELTINQKKSKNFSKGIKFFVYLTDVSSKNGSLAVIPYSHHVVKAITALIVEKKIDLQFYWNLKDLRTLVLKDPVKSLLIEKIGTEKLNIFLNHSNFINDEERDTFKFDLEMKKGGVVIFDELCVHRGSMPSKQNRLVLRYLYCRKIN